MSIWCAVGGGLGCVFVMAFGLWYGVFVEDRTSGEGPNWIFNLGCFALPLVELGALALGVSAWNRKAARWGVFISAAMLAFYFGVWPRMSVFQMLAEITKDR